jgi:flavin-dependent dehydrogenase
VALDVLERLGLSELPWALGAVPLRQIRFASRRSSATIPIGRRMAISRETFDEALVRQAAADGATVCDQTEGWPAAAKHSPLCDVLLRRQESSLTVRAKVVLVATGLAANPPEFRADVSKHSRVGLGTVLDGAGQLPPDTLQMAFGAAGYVGIAAVERGRMDVAAAVLPAALAGVRSPGALVARIFREAGLSPPHGLESAAWRGTPRYARRCRPLGIDRCLLIGDAAGYVEPLTGEGIGWAMLSAVLASELVSPRLDHWDASIARRWQRSYRRTIVPSQRRCRAIGSLFGHASLREWAMWTLRRAPRVAYPVVRRIDRLVPGSWASIRIAE